MATSFTTDIVLGDRYRDIVTGLEGTATSVHFYQYGCERVSLTYLKDGEIKQEGFDAPSLVHATKETPVRAQGTGGPRHTPHDRRP